MKRSIFILLIAFFSITACNKSKSCNNYATTINKTTGICNAWGITINGTIYPAESLPAEFEQEGLKVCVQYELIGSDIVCTCCGTRAKIISISRYDN